MSEPGSLKRTQRCQKALALMSKMAALLGLAALGFLLTRSAMPLPVGWVVILVTVIQIGLAYSPTGGRTASRAAISSRSMQSPLFCYEANSSMAKAEQQGRLKT